MHAIRPYARFGMRTSKYQWFFAKLGMCIDNVKIWLRIAELYNSLSQLLCLYFSFLDYNLSKCQWFFTKIGVCIDNLEVSFGIPNSQILSVLPELSPDMMVAKYYRFMFLKVRVGGGGRGGREAEEWRC